MENNRILVFGSSPQDAPKNVKFEKIYASNASIIKCENFTKLNNNVEIISVTTLDSILFDEPTKKNINKIKPGKIILRRSSGNDEIKIDFKCDLKNFDKFSQWEYQKKFFHFGEISLFLSELFYGSNFKDKIKNFLNAFYFKKKKFLGVSTGFFAILLALDENQNSEIYVSGITMENSDHFYKLSQKSRRVMTRYKVDKFLIKLLKNEYKKRIFSNNKNFANLAKVNYYEN